MEQRALALQTGITLHNLDSKLENYLRSFTTNSSFTDMHDSYSILDNNWILFYRKLKS